MNYMYRYEKSIKTKFSSFCKGNKCHLSCFAMRSSLYGPGIKKNKKWNHSDWKSSMAAILKIYIEILLNW